MGQISVTEADFAAVANAARDAFDAGERDDAKALDKLARKINAALSTDTAKRASGTWHFTRTKASWRDMPSTLPEETDAAPD